MTTMSKKTLPLLVALSVLLIAGMACQMLSPARITPSSTPPPPPTRVPTNTKSSLPTKTILPTKETTKAATKAATKVGTKAATPTPTLRARPSATDTKVPPTRSVSQLDACLKALPSDLPTAMQMITSGSTQNAYPLAVCDNFIDNTNEWDAGDFNGTYVTGVSTVGDGAYTWQGTSNDGAVWYEFPPSGPSTTDFAIVVSARILAGPEGTKIGIFYRSDGDNYYLFSVSRTTYELYILFNDEWEELIPAKPVPPDFDVTTNPGWIAVDVVGSLHTFYLNNEQVEMFTDDRIPQGEVGIGMELEANADVQAKVEFYHFILRGE
jgi:hypothetical protein